MQRKQAYLGDSDIYLFNEGREYRLFDKLGAHLLKGGAAHFSVWAPNAQKVSVIGDFNHWTDGQDALAPEGTSGIWSGTVKNVKAGNLYKYHLTTPCGEALHKADPVGFYKEVSPRTASVIAPIDHYEWRDRQWMRQRGDRQGLDRPMSVYEVHLGSWRRHDKDGGRSLSYRELATELVPYVSEMGFTHVEIMPVMEHPFGGSWGYQITGYFAPTSRYGTPEDFMYLIDCFHQAGIGVILDWVPSHFPNDPHGLAVFDGTHLYEHADPRQGYHPDWNSHIFNYGRNEVRSFLISNAIFWLEKYHIDALRVDAVASMLYLDYSRKEGEWIANRHGGRENLDAVRFLQDLNTAVYAAFPDVQMIAEESTAWPKVSAPVDAGGLGFGLKWDMGWMHDTLNYFSEDPIHRKYHHDKLTFRSVYAFHENFVLSLSHDEFVHGKGSLFNRMPGDDWQKFSNLRCLFTYMYTQPGKKLMFMGCEFAQGKEWDHDRSLEWDLLEDERHVRIRNLVQDLNILYKSEAALHKDCSPEGFEWISGEDADQSVIAYIRKNGGEQLVCIYNMTPVVRHDYKIGVPHAGTWSEIFNSDDQKYGGAGIVNNGQAAQSGHMHNRDYFLSLTLPPLGGIILKCKA